MMLFIARLSAAFLSFQLVTSSSFYPLKIGQDFEAGYSDNDILRGFKMNVQEGENALKDKVFKGETITVPFTSTYDRATFIQSYKDVEDSMGIGGSIGVNYKMTVKGRAEADYVQSATSSKSEERVIYSLRRVAYAKKVNIDTIGNATEELNGFLSPDTIADKYGTKFIDQMLYGAQLDIDFKFSSEDEETMQKVAAELQGEINLKAIAIDFEANFNLTSKENDSYLKVDITASTSGLPGFSIPANPNITQVVEAIDEFQKDYVKLVEEAKNRSQVDNITNVLKMFSPVGFGLSSISDYQPTLSKFETAALENKMADVADVFYDTLYLKGQLKETRDRQETIYSDARDETLWFAPYADEVDRVIQLLDRKVDECLDYQRLPLVEIVGRGDDPGATVPTPNAVNRDIINGLLGNTFLLKDVKILNTEFKNKHYVGYGLEIDGVMKPWLSGSIRDESYRTIARANTPDKLEDLAKKQFDFDEKKLKIYTKDYDNDEKQFILNEWTGDGNADSPNLESFKISDSGSISLKYEAYVEDLGRQDWESSGFVGNPTNVSKSMRAFAIRIAGQTQHSVSYAAKIEHPTEGIVTTRKFRDGEVCCIRRGGNECLEAPIKAIFVTIETKQQYAPCQRSSPCLCEDSICHDATETTSHFPSMMPSMYPTSFPTRSMATRPPTPNPTPDPTPVPTPNPTPDPTPYPTPSNFPPGSLRLVGGSGFHEGRVEMYYQGVWGTICDDDFDSNDGYVICKQLGFRGVIDTYREAHFGQGSGYIFLDDLACNGAEKRLLSCPHSGINVHNCNHGEDAGVKCNINYGSLRLVGGSDSHEGRVEIFYNGNWGTICDDDFDINDANVVCNQLGYNGAEQAYQAAHFGQGSGQIVLDDLGCNGAETALLNCPHSGINVENCGHQEDASVTCRRAYS